jgi:hypothetical protein
MSHNVYFATHCIVFIVDSVYLGVGEYFGLHSDKSFKRNICAAISVLCVRTIYTSHPYVYVRVTTLVHILPSVLFSIHTLQVIHTLSVKCLLFSRFAYDIFLFANPLFLLPPYSILTIYLFCTSIYIFLNSAYIMKYEHFTNIGGY